MFRVPTMSIIRVPTMSMHFAFNPPNLTAALNPDPKPQPCIRYMLVPEAKVPEAKSSRLFSIRVRVRVEG